MAATSVYDMLLAYLEHPFFQIPIISFCEQKCIVFNPGVDDCDEYRKIHKEYCEIVTMILEGFRQDLKMSHEEVIKAVQNIHGTREEFREYFRGLEQVLAMDNYSLFVHMMQKINIELQEQALILILERQGGHSRSGSSQATPSAEDDEEERILAIVLKQSKDEFESMQKRRSQQEEQLDKAVRLSKQETREIQSFQQKEQDRLEHEIRKLAVSDDEPRSRGSSDRHSRQPVAAVPPRSKSSSKPADSSLDDFVLPPTLAAPTSSRTSNNKDAGAAWLADAKQEAASGRTAASMANSMGNLSADEIKQRQEFLKAQRDKLVEMKRQEREKMFKSEESKSGRDRPSSARAARSALKGQKGESSQRNAEEEKRLAMRRAIAAKLKEEVIHN